MFVIALHNLLEGPKTCCPLANIYSVLAVVVSNQHDLRT